MRPLLIFIIFIIIIIQSKLYSVEAEAFDQLNFISYTYLNDTLKIKCDNSNISIIPFTPSIIKINLHTDFTFNSDSSYVVVMQPQKITTNISEKSNYLEFSTDSLDIRIYKTPIKMQFFKKSDLLIEDESGFFTKFDYRGVRFKLTGNEAFFGGGARPAHVNRVGQLFTNYNFNRVGYDMGENTINTCIPLLISEKHFGLYFDTPSFAYCDVGSTNPNILQYNSLTGTFSYFFISGTSYQDILYSYNQLTGTQSMPPRWAFGYMQSRFSYTNYLDFMKIFNQMNEENFPVDAYIFDYGWMEIANGFGNLAWDKNQWPDPLKMNENLLNTGVKSIVVSEPFISLDSKNYKSGLDDSLYCVNSKNELMIFGIMLGNHSLIDLFKPKAREWMFSFYKELKKTGISGWWLDMGEPEAFDSNIRFNTKKEQNMHNLYSTMWIKTLYDGFINLFPNERPFIMSRSGWSGTQRYGAIYQSGDNQRTWSQILAQIYIFLGCSMSGVPYIHPDIGGVAGAKPKDTELYVRGMQLGTFSSFMRAHSNGYIVAEPIFFPDSVKPILRKFLNLRYQLLPYNYSLVIENALTAKPLTRPIFWMYDKTEFLNIDDQYFWGESFLIAPIYDSASIGRNVVLPPGVWIDFWSNEKKKGNQTFFYSVDLSTMPVFVKAGSIIPFAPIMKNTSKYNYDTLIFNYYPDASIPTSSYELFEDDGISPTSISNNQYIISKIKAEYKTNNINVNFEINGHEYKGISKDRSVYYKVIHPGFVPDSVCINQHKLNYYRNLNDFDKVTAGYLYKDSIITCKFNWNLKPVNLEIFHTGFSTDIIDLSENTFQIKFFPNPFSEKIKIETNFKNFLNPQIFIIDVTGSIIGKAVLSERNNDNTIYEWNSTEYPKGVYFIKVINGQDIYIHKVLKY